jgi:multisubunit Na+/H+ antiporter MnhG subunit
MSGFRVDSSRQRHVRSVKARTGIARRWIESEDDMTAKLIILMTVLLTQQAMTGVDSAKFNDVYQAAKAIDVATTTGVTYAQFHVLIQAFAKESAILADKIETKDERAVLLFFKAGLNAYLDSATLWKAKLDMSYDRDEIFQGQILVGTPAIDSQFAPIIKRYQIPTRSISLDLIHKTALTISPDSVRIPWIAARKAIDEAIALYQPRALGPASEDQLNDDAQRLLDAIIKPIKP